MTIHDELVREFVKLNRQGKPIGEHILNIAETGSANIECKLEETYYLYNQEHPNTYLMMTPDVVVTNLSRNYTTAIEIENDIQWDFAQSLRQIKKYRRNRTQFSKVVVIIPKKYERFARYYVNEGFEVYLWEATRLWECLECGTKIPDKRTLKTKCTKRNCKSTNLALAGLEDVNFEPFKER